MTHSTKTLLDIVGVGFGPSNMAVAVQLEESRPDCSSIFIEQYPEPQWQPGMLLDGSDIQNSPFRDLVTPVNPRSRYSFLSYLHEHGRLFEYLNLGVTYPLRKEFAAYVKWVGAQFPNVLYSRTATKLSVVSWAGQKVWCVELSDGEVLHGRSLVVGCGRQLNIPDIPGCRDNPSVVHLTRYLDAVSGRNPAHRVAVLGGSQSAVEIVLDLLGRGFRHITLIHRSFSCRLKDTSPFSDEVYFPEFVDYYHALPPAQRARLDDQVRATNYSSVDSDVLNALYRKMYEDRLDGTPRVTIRRNHELLEVRNDGGALSLRLRDVYTHHESECDADLLLLATGFLDIGRNGRQGLPALLRPLSDSFDWTGDYLRVARDYRVIPAPDSDLPDLYVNGLCESSHGLGDAGSFSLLSLRAQDISRSIHSRLSERRSPHKVKTCLTAST